MPPTLRRLLLLPWLLWACGPSDPSALEGLEPPRGALELETPSAARPARPWNVLLVSLDTLRADRVGAYGYERPTSPNLDRLVEESVLFERAISHSPKTAESHMSLFTGLLPEAHRVQNNRVEGAERLSADVPTLAELFAAAGYQRAAFTGGANVQADLGFDRGFEVYLDRGRDTQRAFERAAEWLREERGPEPFLLFVHTYRVHDPYLPTQESRALFVDPDHEGGPRETREELLSASWSVRNRLFWRAFDKTDARDVQHLSDLYDACIRDVDRELQEFLEVVEELELLEETVVVVFSDHGEEFGEHQGFLHNDLYSEVLHVPLVIRLPGGRHAGRRVAPLVRLIDLFPTLCELVGLPPLAHLQGSSLVPLMDAGSGALRPALSQWRKKDWRTVQVGTWKLIERGPRRRELYELGTDPGERANLLLEDPERAEELALLADELAERSRRLSESATPGEAFALDPEVRAELEALGYLEGED